MSILLSERTGNVIYLTLNRPEKRNALNSQLIKALFAALDEAANDSALRALVIRGAGKDFCAGADLASLRKILEDGITDNLRDAELLMDLFIRIRTLGMPVIAAVAGRALAGGCGLATACDIVLASESARFGYPEVRIGFVPAMVMAILRRNLGEKLSFELITRGFEFNAADARNIGLVNQVYEDGEFEERVAGYANGYEKLSGSAVSLSKKLLYQIDAMDFATALRTGAEVNSIARMTDDCRDGIERFLSR